jgi:hypothetical protein
MPSLAEYRRTVAVESGPYIGPENYEVRATTGTTTSALVCDFYPIKSGIPQFDLLVERPLFRPNAVLVQDRNRYVQEYAPTTGTITPDLPWTVSPLATPGGTTYGELEAQTYGDLEGYTYEDMEGTGFIGIGERFEVLGPFDAPTLHQLINDGLKQCWLVVEVVCTPVEHASRHSLALVAPWLQDPNHVRQAGVLAAGEDRNQTDPFERIVYGEVDRDGGDYYFNTGNRTFNAGDTIYLRCYKRAFDHCRAAGGTYGDQSGLRLETDENPVERDWAASSALVVGWRRFAHLLDPLANQRLVRDQAAATVWFTDRSRQHFNAVAPQLTLRRARRFGPVFR